MFPYYWNGLQSSETMKEICPQVVSVRYGITVGQSQVREMLEVNDHDF